MTTSAPQRVDQRKTQRESTSLQAHIQADGRDIACEIVDLSPSGAKLRVDEPWEVGTRIQLAMELFGLCSGVVIWNKDGLVGLKFSNESLMLSLFVGGWCSLSPAKSTSQKLPLFVY